MALGYELSRSNNAGCDCTFGRGDRTTDCRKFPMWTAASSWIEGGAAVVGKAHAPNPADAASSLFGLLPSPTMELGEPLTVGL
jgi:hypothetical protein